MLIPHEGLTFSSQPGSQSGFFSSVFCLASINLAVRLRHVHGALRDTHVCAFVHDIATGDIHAILAGQPW